MHVVDEIAFSFIKGNFVLTLINKMTFTEVPS